VLIYFKLSIFLVKTILYEGGVKYNNPSKKTGAQNTFILEVNVIIGI